MPVFIPGFSSCPVYHITGMPGRIQWYLMQFRWYLHTQFPPRISREQMQQGTRPAGLQGVGSTCSYRCPCDVVTTCQKILPALSDIPALFSFYPADIYSYFILQVRSYSRPVDSRGTGVRIKKEGWWGLWYLIVPDGTRTILFEMKKIGKYRAWTFSNTPFHRITP